MNTGSCCCHRNRMPSSSSSSSSPPSVQKRSASAIPMHPLDDLDLLSHIFLLVGDRHYRFVAAVNRRFQQAYLRTFFDRCLTNVNASSEEFARICWQDLKLQPRYDWLQSRLFYSAASHGSVPALIYLRAVGCPEHSRVCEVAAKNGHLHVLQWCHENNFLWNSDDICSKAASGGHLHILQWCRENGFVLDTYTCAAAATSSLSQGAQPSRSSHRRRSHRSSPRA